MSTDIDRSGSLDLLVRNGTLVIPGVGQVKADVGIAGGKIVALGENLTQPAAETYDATGRTVLPGIFDPHTHIGNEQSFESEAETETRAAILGGVTTIGIFLRSLEDSVFRSPAGVPQGDGRAQLRRFGLPSADLHRAADRRDSGLCRAVRHPLVQVLHVRHARAS